MAIASVLENILGISKLVPLEKPLDNKSPDGDSKRGVVGIKTKEAAAEHHHVTL